MPWKQANDTQRVDPSNGLLLEATIDALFDSYLITFADDGSIRVSPKLASYRGIFGLKGNLKKVLRGRQKAYLRIHRKEFDKRRRREEMDMDRPSKSISR
jgi:hypothetical protein